MSVDIRVPALGESVVEATVGRWLKQEGEPVAAGEPVVELETEKVNTDLPADEAGVLERVLKREGETVHPGDVLATIVPGQPAAPAPTPATAAPEPAPAAAPPSQAAEAEKERVTPVAQRMAAELGVDLARVPGSGPAGRVTREDVETFARQAAPPPTPPSPAAPPTPPPAAPATAPAATSAPSAAPPAPAPPATQPTPPTATAAVPPAPLVPAPPAVPGARPETRQRLSRRRLTIARRLVEAQRNAAMLSTFNEIDMTAVIALRQRWRDGFRQRYGVTLGYMPFFVKAVVGALKAFPEVNSELQGDELVLKGYYDIGIAIGDPEGLVVPVLRDADRLTFAQIEQAIARFVEQARDHALSLEDLRGGTFTITNGGVYGSLLSTPILNPPQVGILGMHKIEDRPIAVNGQVAIRPMMYLALTYDHRVVDGRQAVLFLVRLKDLLEDPERLLIEA